MAPVIFMTELVYHPIYSRLELPSHHRFPIQKYAAIYASLIAAGVSPSRFHTPEAISRQLLNQVFDHQYVDDFLNGSLCPKAMRRIGFPWSEQLVARTLTAVGGTLLTSQLALASGLALNLTGGYHHGFADFGSGFCIFNDLYLSARHLIAHSDIEKVLIIDCDVHQGDGTASLSREDEQIFTVSLHGAKNFPYRKQISDLDIDLESHTQDDEYLTALHQALLVCERSFQPDFILYDAGVDIHQHDDLGLLAISTQGVLERDKMVLAYAKQLGVPLAAVIGGGYQRDIAALTDVHLSLFRAAGVIPD